MKKVLGLFLFLLMSFNTMGQEERFNSSQLADEFWVLINTENSQLAGVDFINEHQATLDQIIKELTRKLSTEDSLFVKIYGYSGALYLASPQAVNHLYKAVLPTARTLNDTLAISESLLKLGMTDIDMGRYEESIVSLLELMSIVGKDRYPWLYAEGLNQIAVNYLETDQLEIAIARYKELIDLSIELKEYRSLIVSYHNLGLCYLNIEAFDKAEIYFDKAYEVIKEQNENDLESSVLGNLAAIYMENGRIEKAIEYQTRGLALEESVDNKLAMIDSNGILGLCYLELEDLEKFEYHYNQALSLAMELNAYDKLLDVYSAGASAFEQAGMYEEAFENVTSYIDLKDSLFSVTQSQQLTEMREKYEADQRESQIGALRKDNALARSQNLILIITAIAILVIASFAFVLFAQTRKRKREVEERNELITGINQKLNESQDALLASNQLKDKFFALVAHDLRGPVTSFQGIGQMLEYMIKKGNQERVNELIKSVDQSANNVNLLLDNLLKWSLSQTGTLSHLPEPLELSVLTEDILEVYQQTAEAKGIDITRQIPPDTWVQCDRNMLSTVLRNLIGNALKFTSTGGKVMVEAIVMDDLCQIKVIDNGVGIAADKLSGIFDLSDRKSTSGTAGEKGTGLGLILCKEFIEKNEGLINMESQPGEGTTAIIQLPLALKKAKEATLA